MLRAAIRDNTHFEISPADMDRPPPHFAVGTMAWLRQRQPGKRFAYLMGSDSLRDLPTWHEPAQFLQQCEALGVMNRPQREVDLAALEKQLPGVREKTIFFDAPLVSISGRAIRRRVHEGSPYRYLVPQAVAEIIRRSGLYL
jgi:nicotinate-nucleotide adenylyltransferase